MSSSTRKIITGTVLAGENFRILDPGTIVVCGDRIEAVLGGTPPSVERGQNIIDAGDCVICPGLINAHTHLADSLVKEVAVGLSLEEAVLPPHSLKDEILKETGHEEMRASVRNALKEMIRTGTVSFCEFRDQGIYGMELLYEALEDLPLKPFLLGRTRRYPPFSEEELLQNSKSFSDETLTEIEAVINKGHGFSLATVNDLTEPALSKLGQIRKRCPGKLIAVHGSENPAIRDKSIRLTGESDVKRALRILKPDFLVHLIHASDEDLDSVAETKTPVVISPRANAALGLGIYDLQKLASRGILAGLGTDNVMLSSVDLFREMEFISKLSRGLHRNANWPRAVDILKMATVNNAKILRCDRDLGSIDKGKMANLIFINKKTTNLAPVKDPIATLVHRVDPGDIQSLMIRGAFVKNGF